MAKTQTQRAKYAISRSPFFRLHSRQSLASLLGLTLSQMEALASSPSNALYRMYDDDASGRYITTPLPELQRVHKRIARLFSRITAPRYLQSATKKRSYKTNAEMHRTNSRIFKIDIRQYYPSVSFGAVFNFFRKQMECSVDVATVLTKLCTVSARGRTHLPTGSNLSPILSYWVHSALFDKIKLMCDSVNCAMSLYVDDITVSGEKATSALIAKIEEVIAAAGLTSHKVKMYDGVPATVTGVVVHKGRLALPHARARAIRELRESMATLAPSEVDATLSKLVGKLNEAQQFVGSYGAIKKKVLSTHAAAWKRITESRVAKSKAAAKRRRVKAAKTAAAKAC